MKRNFVALLTMLSLGLSSFGQGKVTWSELESSNGRLSDVISAEEDAFYAFRRSGIMGRKLKASYHDNLESIIDGNLELRAPNGSPAIFEAATMVGGKFVVFLSDRQEGENKFFMQEYNKDIEPSGDGVELTSYSLEGKRKRFQGSFRLIQSQNRDYFTVVWTLPGRKEEQATYGYKTFDKDLNQIAEGEYEVPFKERFSTINGFYLTDSGDFFVSITEYAESEKKRIFNNYLNYVAVHLYHIAADGEVEEMEIDLDGKRVEAMSFNSDNDKFFVITGIYGEKGQSGVKGMFYLRLDYKTKAIESEGFEEFGEDFITSDWSDRQKKKLEKKKKKGKDAEPTLYSYVMREVHPLPDGSIVGTMEQYYVRVVTTTNSQTGQTTTTYYYYYNDIVAYKVAEDGGFQWLAKVNKYQVSTNDGGYYSSYARYVHGDKMYLFFNDNVQNYNEETGDFVDDGTLKSARLSKKKNVVAVCGIDLESGEMEREIYFDRSEIGAIVVPKLFNIDYLAQRMLIYAIKGKKEKFGYVDFGG